MRNVIFFIVLLMLGNIYSQADIDSGLVAFYPFNGDANDEGGNDNHGIVMGAVLTIDRFGIDSTAYEFDGTSSYIAVPNSQTLQSPSTELSQVAWINIYSWSLVGTQFGPILMKSNSGTNAFQYRLAVGQNGVYTAINNWSNAVAIFDTLNFNEWYMIVSTLKDDTVKTYVNGLFIGEGTLAGPMSPDSRPLEIGRDVPGLIEFFHGKIDDVRIYNRALTDAEIQELFTISTDVDKINPQKLNHYQLFQNFPNPFNPTTTIEYSLPQDGQVTVSIYNVSGQRVQLLKDEFQTAGNHSLTWNSTGMPSGLYFCTLKANGISETRKMVVVK